MKLQPLIRKAKREGWGRFIRSEADERAVLGGCYVDLDAASHVEAFFAGYLRHSKGEWAGKPFELLEWQREDLIFPLFGWMRPDGLRRFRRAYVEIPKKNGKSTLGAGLGLYMLIGDCEPGAEVYSAATDQKQAGIVHGEAIHMVGSSRELSSRLKVNHTTNRIYDRSTKSTYDAMSSTSAGKEGLNIHCCIIDELHVWHGRALWDAIRYGFAVRSQPLLFVITTAGMTDSTALCYKEHLYAEQVLNGLEDQEYFAYIASANKDDDYTDPKVWEKANPSFGVMIREEEMRVAATEAKRRPSVLNSFLRYRLNIWTQQIERFISMDLWNENDTLVDAESLYGRECFAGLDLGSTRDLTALSLVFPNDDGSYDVLPFFWIPEWTAQERAKADNAPYLPWLRDGWMESTDGNVVDYDAIYNKIIELSEIYNIREVAADRWNAQHIITKLDQAGLTIFPFGQGYASMAGPTKELEKLVAEKKLNHGGNPVLRWMAGNVAVEQDAAGNLKPSKKRSSEKIDGIVATIMALGRATVATNAPISRYMTNGIRGL